MNTLKKENQPKVDLQKTTWTSVQDVAKSEKQANGKLLYITKNLFSMYKNNQINITKYFDETENDTSVKKIFFNTDGTRKTLIAKDFSLFVDRVLIPAMGQNLENFRKWYLYEYQVLISVSPCFLFLIDNEKHINIDTLLNEETDPVQIGLDWKIFNFKDLKDQNQAIFRSNFVKKFFLESEQGKPYYTTFRGERGFVDMVKTWFVPKIVSNEIVKNATVSPFAMQLKKLVEKDKGLFDKNTLLTKVSTSPDVPETDKQNARLRQGVEINLCQDIAEKNIELIASAESESATNALIKLYSLIGFHLEDVKVYGKSKAKINLNPRVNNKEIPISSDLIKYCNNI
jgi:hypothetical protein